MKQNDWVLIFVDTEDANPTETGWTLREFGAVEFVSKKTFHGKNCSEDTFTEFMCWLREVCGKELQDVRLVFVTDNIAYDWPPMHFYLMKYFGYNPFGHSARRIGDFYAGLVGDFKKSSSWKSLRITKHDHNPVNDAMGNVEAFERMLRGDRASDRKKKE